VAVTTSKNSCASCMMLIVPDMGNFTIDAVSNTMLL